MPVDEAVKDAERQTYYQGYLESMVTAVSRFPFFFGLFWGREHFVVSVC